MIEIFFIIGLYFNGCEFKSNHFSHQYSTSTFERMGDRVNISIFIHIIIWILMWINSKILTKAITVCCKWNFDYIHINIFFEVFKLSFQIVLNIKKMNHFFIYFCFFNMKMRSLEIIWFYGCIHWGSWPKKDLSLKSKLVID